VIAITVLLRMGGDDVQYSIWATTVNAACVVGLASLRSSRRRHCSDEPQLSRRLSSDRIVPPSPTRVSPALMSMNSAKPDSTACQYLDPKPALTVR
jgi:hypothetical protein